MTSISLITCNIFCLSQWFGSIVTVFTLFRTFRRVYVRHSPSKEWRSVFLILCLPLSLSLFPSNTLEKLCKQFCNFARGRYHLVNENTWPSTPRKRTTIYYFTLHCYRFVNTPRIRDENEQNTKPTPIRDKNSSHKESLPCFGAHPKERFRPKMNRRLR